MSIIANSSTIESPTAQKSGGAVPTNYFARIAQLGYSRLVPVIPPDAPISEGSSLFKRIGTKQDGRGKTPGVQGKDGKFYSFDWTPYEADERDHHRWHGMGAGVGIKTGNGIIAIDADTMNAAHAKTIKDIVDELVGPCPIRIGQYPKAIYLVRCSAPLPYQRIEFGDERVEILTEGKFFVAQGIHPKTNKPYTWPKPIVALDELPTLSPDQVTALLERLRSALPEASKVIKEGGEAVIPQHALRGDPALIRKAVAAIPNTSALFPSREAYRDMGYAIKAAVEHDGEAFDIFAEWCDRWVDGPDDGNHPDVVAADWSRMKPPFRRGAPWIYEKAETHGDGKFSVSEVWFDNIDEKPLQPTLSELFAAAEKPGGTQSRTFEFLRFADVATSGLTTNPSLIKGLLDQGAMSVLYGDSNVGKTFVAMDMAFHIGAGLNYGGLRTTAGLVAYVAAEGGNGAKKRLVALRNKYPGVDPDFVLLPASVDLRRPGADLVPLIAALKTLGAPVAMLVVDTLSRAMAGGDENSSVDMGALVKNFDALRQAIAPAHLMIVHHTGKDKAKGARGHSLLRAATDTEIEVADGVIAATKQRDMDKSWASAFSLDVVRLGLDADGDPITSCTVRLEDVQAVRKRDLTQGETDVLKVIALLADTSEATDESVKIADLKSWFKDKLSVNSLNSHLQNLVKKGCVSRERRGHLVLVEKVESAECVEECVEGLFA